MATYTSNSERAYAERRRRFAEHGTILMRSDALDGPVAYFLITGPTVRVAPDLETLDRVLDVADARRSELWP